MGLLAAVRSPSRSAGAGARRLRSVLIGIAFGASIAAHSRLPAAFRDLAAREQARGTYSVLMDAEALARLNDLLSRPARPQYRSAEDLGRSLLLAELSQRRRPAVAAGLESLRREWRARQATSPLGIPHELDLELLVALRRAQGRPDPVELVIRGPLAATFPALPKLEVEVRRAAEEAETIEFPLLDFNLGGASSWRIEIVPIDGDGRTAGSVLETAHSLGFVMGWARPWTTTALTREPAVIPLNLAQHCGMTAGERFSVRVLHHSGWSIKDLPDAGRFLVLSSPPTRFDWSNRTLSLSAEVRSCVREQVARLSGERVKLVYPDPEEPLACEAWLARRTEDPPLVLYKFGYSALPGLFDALEGDQTIEQRSWTFATLYSITRLYEPSGYPDVLRATDVVKPPSCYAREFENSWAGGGSREQSQEAQEQLRRSWLALRPMLIVE
jgi:hypothetical protein